MLIVTDNQMKRIYAAICEYKSKSGTSWDDMRGADIELEGGGEWENHIKKTVRTLQSADETNTDFNCSINHYLDLGTVKTIS